MSVASCDINARGSKPDSMISLRFFTTFIVHADGAKSSRPTNFLS